MNAEEAIKKRLGDNLERAAIHLVNRIKENVNRSQPYTIYRGQGISYKGDDPSLPGEYPKKVRGDLQRSIVYEMSADRQSAKIGTNLDYGAYLELGTQDMAARPFLRSTVATEKDKVNEILAKGA